MEEDEEVAAFGAHQGAARSTGLFAMLRAMPRYTWLLLRLSWRAAPGATLAACLLQLAVAAGSAFGLLAVAGAAGSLLAGRPSPESLRAALPTLLLVVAVYAVRGLLQAGAVAAAARLSPTVRRVAEMRMLQIAAGVDLVAFHDDRFYDLMLRARDKSAPYLGQSVDGMMQFAGALVSLLAMTGTLAVLDWRFFPVLAASVLPQAWAAAQGARLTYTTALATFAANRRLWFTSDLIADGQHAAEVRALTAQRYLLERCRRLALALQRTQTRLGYVKAGYDLLGRALSGLGLAAAFALLAYLVATGGTSPGDAGAAVVAIQVGRAALVQLAQSLNGLYEQSLYVQDYADFLADGAARTRPPTTAGAPQRPWEIELDGVTFAYPGQGRPAVRGVSLAVRQGEVLALVGENGSGKTTLALLLAGLLTPDAGAVRWDGVDLAAVDPATVHRQVAMVMQNPGRWPLTARENVLIGRPERADADGAAFAAAVRDGGAGDLGPGLARGWETLLSTRFKNGQDLSGGQWQRLAVARALYRDAPLLICDEPTAALDARGEAAVYDSLRRLARDRTVVLVTHRMISTRDADRIAVLHEGALVELGPHDQLLAAGGRYAELYDLQAAAYRAAA